MRINLSDPTQYEAAEWAGTLAQAQDAVDQLVFDDWARCPCCDAVLNLDIWELPDGTGHLMQVCECGFVEFDSNRIVVRHEVDDSPPDLAPALFDQDPVIEHEFAGDFG